MTTEQMDWLDDQRHRDRLRRRDHLRSGTAEAAVRTLLVHLGEGLAAIGALGGTRGERQREAWREPPVFLHPAGFSRPSYRGIQLLKK